MDSISKSETIRDENLGRGVTDGNGLSWLVSYGTVVGGQEVAVAPHEIEILRSLARRVAEHAHHPVQEERRRMWSSHHSLKPTRPLVFIDPEYAWYEILPHTQLRCGNNLARIWEYRLLKELCWQEEIRDDRVCTGEFTVQHVYSETGFGIDNKITGGEGGGAYHIEGGLSSYDDLHRLCFREIVVDYEKTNRLLETAHDIFGGILDVKVRNSWWYSLGLTFDAIKLRGFENFLYDMYDNPRGLHALMAFLRDEAVHRLDFLEENGLLSLNNGGEFMGTGGYGWCGELPSAGYDESRVRPIDMWGYGESQETVSVSPEAFDEFVLPYQLPLLERFGLNAYGCCEPLDTRISLIKKKIPRLRKVTVSPWSDVRRMAGELGPGYACCLKVNPSSIAVAGIGEAAIRSELRELFSVTRECGCPSDVLMRDICTLAFRKENAVRWTRIAMEEAGAV